MATPLDPVVLQHFLPVVSFLFVFVISYALFHKADILRDKNLDLIAAFSVSLLFLFTPEAITIIETATPWFILFVIFLVLIFTTFLFLGFNQESLQDLIRNPTVYYPIVIIVIGIFLFSLSQVFGDQVQSVFGGGEVDNGEGGLLIDIVGVVLHPRLLAAIFLLLVASLAIRLIAAPPK